LKEFSKTRKVVLEKTLLFKKSSDTLYSDLIQFFYFLIDDQFHYSAFISLLSTINLHVLRLNQKKKSTDDILFKNHSFGLLKPPNVEIHQNLNIDFFVTMKIFSLSGK